MELNALTIPRLDLSDHPDHIRQQFHKTGAVIVGNALKPDLLHRFRHGIRQLLHRQLHQATADSTSESCFSQACSSQDRASKDHHCKNRLSKNRLSKKHGDGDLDELFSTLCAIDRQRGGYVYDAIQWLPEYLEILSSSGLTDAAKILLNTPNVISPPILSWVRIDRSGEQRNYFPWHQDYTYNLASRPTVTAWIPLFEITEEMGPLTIVPGSHRFHYPVEVHESDRYATLTDINLDELEENAVTIAPQVGDALFFHQLLLHRSGSNQSERARWVFNARWASLDDPLFTDRGWQFRRERSFQMLQQLHPDKYKAMAEQPAVTE
jgi:hypothetical protein